MKEKEKLKIKIRDETKKIKQFRDFLFNFDVKNCNDKKYFNDRLQELKKEHIKIFGYLKDK